MKYLNTPRQWHAMQIATPPIYCLYKAFAKRFSLFCIFQYLSKSLIMHILKANASFLDVMVIIYTWVGTNYYMCVLFSRGRLPIFINECHGNTQTSLQYFKYMYVYIYILRFSTKTHILNCKIVVFDMTKLFIPY